MSQAYAKVFASMYSGSMYGAGMHVFAVWGWALARKDENGLVEVNPDLAAAELGGLQQQVLDALAYLCAPDPKSRTADEQGRRLVKVSQFGYQVVNHEQYAARGASRSQYWRDWRAKRRSSATVAQRCAQHMSTHAEANADEESDKVLANDRGVGEGDQPVSCPALQKPNDDQDVVCPALPEPNWLNTSHALEAAFPGNGTISRFRAWISNRMLLSASDGEVRAVCGLILALIRKAFTEGDDPPAWFIGAVKKPVSEGGFGYRPTGRRRGRTTIPAGVHNG